MIRRLLATGLAAVVLPLGQGVCGEPEVPVYTNQDLEQRFGPPSPQPDRPGGSDAERWADVAEFLDRQYARIDADRRHELDQRESDRADRVMVGDWSRREPSGFGWYPCGGYWPYSWGGGVWIGSNWSGRFGYDAHRSSGAYAVGHRGSRGGGPHDGKRGYASEHAASAHINAMRHRAFLSERPTLGQPGRHPLAASPGHAKGRK